jgi:hypothetical protein
MNPSTLRLVLLSISLSCTSLCVTACTGHVEPSPDPSPPSDTPAGSIPISGDASAEGSVVSTAGDTGSCNVVVSNYDQSCTKDSDCVLVPPGGNVCDPCSNVFTYAADDTGIGCLVCDVAAVNVDASAQYLSALGTVPWRADAGAIQCSSTCPEAVATCQQGTCATVFTTENANCTSSSH